MPHDDNDNHPFLADRKYQHVIRLIAELEEFVKGPGGFALRPALTLAYALERQITEDLQWQQAVDALRKNTTGMEPIE